MQKAPLFLAINWTEVSTPKKRIPISMGFNRDIIGYFQPIKVHPHGLEGSLIISHTDYDHGDFEWNISGLLDPSVGISPIKEVWLTLNPRTQYPSVVKFETEQDYFSVEGIDCNGIKSKHKSEAFNII